MQAPIRDLIGGLPLPQSWVTWFQTVDNFIRSGSSSGTTANRPTKNLFVGLSYMDSDLGKQIQIQSLNPTVWIDSNGDNPDVAPVVVVAESPAEYKLFQQGTFTNYYTAYTQTASGYTGAGFSANYPTPILFDGHTQCRLLFFYAAATKAGFLATLQYSAINGNPETLDPSQQLCDPPMSVNTGTIYTIADSGWCNLVSGIDGIKHVSLYLGGSDNSVAAGAYIGNAILLLK